MVVEIGVFVAPGRHAARQVLGEMCNREPARIKDVAVVERPTRGPDSVHSAWAQNEADDRTVLGFGARSGALVGVLPGPGEVLTGPLFGSTAGGPIGAGMDFVDFDRRLAEIVEALPPASSSTMSWTDSTDVDAYVTVLRSLHIFKAKFVRSSLNVKRDRRLKAAMRGEGCRPAVFSRRLLFDRSPRPTRRHGLSVYGGQR